MSRKILLVDDEPINNRINKMVFQKVQPANEYADYTDPVAAFAAMAEMQPELIFLDINMPIMSGWDFLDKMKEEGIGTNVIILSSSISSMDTDKAATYANVIEYMNKPPDKTILQKHL